LRQSDLFFSENSAKCPVKLATKKHLIVKTSKSKRTLQVNSYVPSGCYPVDYMARLGHHHSGTSTLFLYLCPKRQQADFFCINSHWVL